MSDNIDRLNVPGNNMLMTMEDITGRIKAGEIESVTVVAVAKDGVLITGTSSGRSDDLVATYTIIGALEAEKALLLTRRDGQLGKEIEKIALEGP